MADQVAIKQSRLNAMGQATPQSKGTAAGSVCYDKVPVEKLPSKPSNGNY